MEKIRFNLINMLLLLTLVSFTACKQDDDSVPSGEKSLVTIRTYLSAPVGVLPTRAGTSTTEVLPDGETHYKDPNTDKENEVFRVRVFACLGDKVVKNILYLPPNRQSHTVSPSEEIRNFRIDQASSSILMDIELMPDTYTFILVANEESLYEPGTPSATIDFSSITSMTQLEQIMVAPSKITSNKDLDNTDYTGIPMKVERQITVPQGRYNASNKWVTPTLELERTLAKVEFYVKNTDDSGREFPKNAFPENEFSVFNSLQLINANPSYRLMKDEPINDGIGILENVVLKGTHFGEEFNNYIPKNTEYDKFLKGKDHQKEIVWYMNPRTGVTADNATTIVFGVNHTKSGETAVNNKYYFKVPLYQTLNEEKVYDIKRNTIYRIYGTLRGAKFDYNIDVVVDPWKNNNKGDFPYSFGGSNGL